MRICWPGLLGALIAAVLACDGHAQEHPTRWESWNASVATSATPTPAAIQVPDSVRVRRGYQHWRGAALGAAIGGAVGALAGAVVGGVTSCDDCRRQPTVGNGALYGGLGGVGVGGVTGFLVGLSLPRYRWIPRAEAPR